MGVTLSGGSYGSTATADNTQDRPGVSRDIHCDIAGWQRIEPADFEAAARVVKGDETAQAQAALNLIAIHRESAAVDHRAARMITVVACQQDCAGTVLPETA